MIRFTTAGESHGQAILAILEGIPSGLNINSEDIDVDLARRQKGYGRGKKPIKLISCPELDMQELWVHP